MASSLISEASKLYNSFSEAVSKTLSSALQENLNQLSATLDRYLPESITDNFPNSNILLLSLLLPIFLFFSMSSWGQRFWPASGRYSPFAAHGGPPRVSDADYSYIADDDIAGTSPHNSTYALHGHHHHHVPRAESTNALAPDILVLRHKGTFYPLHFPAFSIAEGDLSVADLRRCAARETGCNDERRVKLLYKGKALKDDRRACRDEGLKQNSEIMCIVSTSPDTYHEGGQRIDDGMSTSQSGDDDDPYEDERDIRADVDGTTVGRGERRRKRATEVAEGGRPEAAIIVRQQVLAAQATSTQNPHMHITIAENPHPYAPQPRTFRPNHQQHLPHDQPLHLTHQKESSTPSHVHSTTPSSHSVYNT